MPTSTKTKRSSLSTVVDGTYFPAGRDLMNARYSDEEKVDDPSSGDDEQLDEEELDLEMDTDRPVVEVVDHHPMTAATVMVGDSTCGAPMNVASNNGRKIAVVCTRPRAKCNLHKERHRQHRLPNGMYLEASEASSSFTHQPGLLSAGVAPIVWESSGRNGSESEDSSRVLDVTPASTGVPRRSSRFTSTTQPDHDDDQTSITDFFQASPARSKSKSTTKSPTPTKRSVLSNRKSLYTGLVHPLGERRAVKTKKEVQQLVRGGFISSMTFSSSLAASTWVSRGLQIVPKPPPTASGKTKRRKSRKALAKVLANPEDYPKQSRTTPTRGESGPRSRPQSKKSKKSKSKSKPKSQVKSKSRAITFDLGSDFDSDSSSSMPGLHPRSHEDDSSDDGSCFSTSDSSFAPSVVSNSSSNASSIASSAPSFSSGSSSSSSYSSSSSSSGDSTIRRHRRNHRRKKKKKSQKSKNRDKRLVLRAKLRKLQDSVDRDKRRITRSGRDKSRDKSDAIFGTKINSDSLPSKIYPVGTKQRDKEEVASILPDVTAMGIENKGNVMSELNNNNDMTDVIEQMSRRRGGRHVERVVKRDTSFNRETRHGLADLLKSEDHFHDGLSAIQGDGDQIFEQMEINLAEYLVRRYWSTVAVETFCEGGGFVVLVRLTYEYYVALLTHISRLINQHGWRSGPAIPTLRFHSDKMLRIRRFANSKEQLHLQMYTYLRDAKFNHFTNPRIAHDIWAELDLARRMVAQCIPGQQQASPLLPTSPAGTPLDPKCSRCASRTFHRRIRPFPGTGNECCPLNHLSKKIAKDARIRILKAADEDGQDTFDATFMKPHIDAAVAAGKTD